MNPKHTDLVKESTGKPKRSSFAQGMHPNPRFYKYFWRVFHSGSIEGEAFFTTPVLSTNEMAKTCRQLEENGEGYLLYNWNRPRTGAHVPFDFNHPKWRDSIVAPAYDEDKDLPWRGHK